MKSKRGFELAISTLVLLILGMVVLIMLIVFITMGSSNFSNTIKSYFSYSNVDSVINSCNLFSQSNSQYKYCCEKNKVKYYSDGVKVEGDFSCKDMLNMSFVNNLAQLNCFNVNC